MLSGKYISCEVVRKKQIKFYLFKRIFDYLYLKKKLINFFQRERLLLKERGGRGEGEGLRGEEEGERDVKKG